MLVSQDAKTKLMLSTNAQPAPPLVDTDALGDAINPLLGVFCPTDDDTTTGN